MQRSLLTLLYCFFSLFAANAQEQLNTFHVVDSLTHKAVPAVSIVIVRAKLAISTEKDGIFTIPGDLTKMRDTVLIYAQSYNPYKVLLHKMYGMDTLRLTKLQRPAVNLNSAETNDLELNRFIKSDVAYYAGVHTETALFDYLQLAQQFYLPKTGALLKKINIVRLAFNLNYEQQEDDVEMELTTFRLRIYEADTIKGGPGNELSDQVIEIKNRDNQHISVNVSDHQIIIPGKSFFVAVEWMRDFRNQGYAMVRQKNSGDKQLINFRPAIGISPVKGGKLNIWALNFKRQWKPYAYFYPDFTDLAMSVVVAR